MRKVLALAVMALAIVACKQKADNKFLPNDPRVDELMKKMTLEEKVGQTVLFTSDWSVTGPSMRDNYLEDIKAGRCGALLNAYSADFTREIQRAAVENTRLGIPILFGFDVIHGFRTIFPINLGMSCSWDIDAIEQSARIAAEEAAAAGLHWTYSPMCDISVEPRWGRISEGSGEDPYLGSLISAAMTRGYQGESLSEDNTILACVKHFAAYGAPQAGRDYNTVDMSERWFREFYLPPYKAAIDAGALSVMSSFNELDGVPAHASKHLLTDILKGEWGFEGFVVSDYTGINEMIMHGYAKDSEHAGELSMNAGLDMDMMSASYMNHMVDLVKSGKVKESTLDNAVRRILNVKAALGLLDDPYKYCDMEREKERTLTEENKAFARKLAGESMVLLKNDGVLPLKKGVKTAVIGPLADSKNDMLGSWRGAGEEKSVPASVKDAIKEIAPVVPESQAQQIVLVLGEPWDWTGEAASRTSINLPKEQTELLEKLAKQGKKVAVVLMNGRPLDLSRESELASALLEAWYPGTMGGYAVADVLFGDYNPSGKLSVTFPRNLGQVPIYHYAKNTGRPYIHPDAKYESRYLDCPNEPLYAFGHGLSYTTFDYSEVTVIPSKAKESFTAKVTVTNTGAVEGTETVQLYIRDLVGSVTRPVKQLKGFQRITLQPGESAEVTFTITKEMLSFYRQDMTWGPEPGEFKVFIGGASDNVKEASFTYEI
jgi:beta-glucosidase